VAAFFVAFFFEPGFVLPAAIVKRYKKDDEDEEAE